MTHDFYCDEVLCGRTPVEKVKETENFLAFHHTRPSYPVHIVVTPKHHIASLLSLEGNDAMLIVEMMQIIREVAAQVTNEEGRCRVITNLGAYQDSKHLHWHIISGAQIKRS